jgi:hypothetical protein
MKCLFILLAAASVAACSSRAEDQAGAAPDTGDTTATTHVIDTTRTGPPGTGGRPGNATVTTDSVLDDTLGVQTDTTMMNTGESPVSPPRDTLGPRDPGTYETDTTQFGTDTTGMHDTTHFGTDTTGMQAQ